MEPKLRISASTDIPDTLSDWPPSPLRPSRDKLEDWIRLFTAIGRWDRVDECERALFRSLRDPRELHDALLRSGDRWWRNKGDMGRARVRYREALETDRRSERALARLRAIGHEIARRRVQPFRPA